MGEQLIETVEATPLFLTRSSQPPLPPGPVHAYATSADLDEIAPKFGLTSLPKAARIAGLSYPTALRAMRRLDDLPTPRGSGVAVLLTDEQLERLIHWADEVRLLRARLRELGVNE